jgi:putative ABC transport system ATP-binding protein
VKRPAGISLNSVSKRYTTPSETITAVSKITLELEPGGTLAIMGPSGCGKSTLLGLIGGLETPTEGRIIVGGEDIARLSDGQRSRLRREEFGFVFQRDNLLPYLTGVENVALQLEMQGLEDGFDRCFEVLAELGLEDEVDKLPDQLSGGQRQRVAVACALVKRPSVVLADEPTGSLDAENSTTVMDLLLNLHRQVRTTLLVVTHDTEVASRMDSALSMRDGQLVEKSYGSGPPQAKRADA